MHVLLLFLDGVGIGSINPERNPFFSARLPTLRRVLGGVLPSIQNSFIRSQDALCIPTSATLRTAGLPQSGTGQATLYTGINCAKKIGKHFGPYLYSTLKPIVAEKNIFTQLKAMNGHSRVALANAFPQRFFDYIDGDRKRIVTGVYAAMKSRVQIRTIKHLIDGTAVSTEITGARWQKIGHIDAPVITAYQAGERLAALTRENHFTLYEYFHTDKAGHEQNMWMAISMIEQIDELLAGVLDHVDLSTTLIYVTSDHGNLEDLATKSHTRNRVPTIILGKKREHAARGIRSIEDVAESIVRVVKIN